VVILATGWLWVDPVIALALAALILVSGLGLLRESLDLAMDAVPDHADDALLQSVSDTLKTKFQIQHPTIQVERGNASEHCVYTAPANGAAVGGSSTRLRDGPFG